MLKELPKVGQVVIAVQDEYEWENTDQRYLTCYEKYGVVGRHEESGNPYIIDDLGEKCYIDENSFYLYELGININRDWIETEDILYLRTASQGVEISSNYGTWEVSKGEDEPFFLEINGYSTGLNVEEAEQLRNYLSHKIEYLKEEN